jgi:hypothetical protein
MTFLEAFYYEVDCYDFDNEKIMFHNTWKMTNADRIWGAIVKNYYGHLNTVSFAAVSPCVYSLLSVAVTDYRIQPNVQISHSCDKEIFRYLEILFLHVKEKGFRNLMM